MKQFELDLIGRIKQCDQRAIRIFIDTYTPPVYAAIFAYVKNHTEAEEICDDIFLSTIEKLENSECATSLIAFLTRIAINKSIHYLNLKNSILEVPQISNTPRHTCSDSPVMTALEMSKKDHNLKREQYIALHVCINKLSDRQRTATLLQLNTQLSFKGIANIMRTTEKEIQSLLNRSIISLKGHLKGHDSSLFKNFMGP